MGSLVWIGFITFFIVSLLVGVRLLLLWVAHAPAPRAPDRNRRSGYRPGGIRPARGLRVLRRVEARPVCAGGDRRAGGGDRCHRQAHLQLACVSPAKPCGGCDSHRRCAASSRGLARRVGNGRIRRGEQGKLHHPVPHLSPDRLPPLGFRGGTALLDHDAAPRAPRPRRSRGHESLPVVGDRRRRRRPGLLHRHRRPARDRLRYLGHPWATTQPPSTGSIAAIALWFAFVPPPSSP